MCTLPVLVCAATHAKPCKSAAAHSLVARLMHLIESNIVMRAVRFAKLVGQLPFGVRGIGKR